MRQATYERIEIGSRPAVPRNQLRSVGVPEAGEWNPAVVLFGHITGDHGERGTVHVHEGAVEYLFTIEGEATVRVDGEDVVCRAGDLLIIAPDTEHPVLVTGERWRAVSSVVARDEASL